MHIMAHMSRTAVNVPHNVRELADLWLVEIDVSGVTQRAYRLELERFIRWVRVAGVAFSELNSQSFADFGNCICSDRPAILQPLGVSKPLLASSLGQTRRIVGAWLRWAAAEGWASASLATPSEWPIVYRKSMPKKIIAARQLDHVLSPNIKRKRLGLRKSREQFVAGLTFWLGLSPHEIAKLRRDDIRIREGRFELLTKEDDRFIGWTLAPDPLLHAWKSYEKERGTSKFAVTDIRTRNEVSVATIKRIVRGIRTPKADENATESINCRELRRSFIKHAIDCGWSSDDLKRHLRRQTIAGAVVPRKPRRKWIEKLQTLDFKSSS